MKELSSKHPEKCKFIIKGGTALHNAIIHLFSIVWRTEAIPDSWINTELVQLWKGKGDKNSMLSQRFLHIKDCVPKIFQHIVINSAKENLITNMTKFQIACKPGHRAEEHVFCVMSLIQLSERLNTALYLKLFDIQKYFDKESAIDCHTELYRAVVQT